MRASLLLVVAACGRVGFEATRDAQVLGDGVAADGVLADVAGDAAVLWSTPQIVDLGITGMDDPSMTGDGLEICVNCGTDVCCSDRLTTADPWPTVVKQLTLPAGA